MTKEQIYELKHKRVQAVEAAKGLLTQKDMAGYEAKMAEVDGFNAEIEASEKLLAEEGRFEDGEGGYVTLSAAQAKKKEEEQTAKGLDALRGTNEYAQAFGKAMMEGATVKKCWGVEAYKPLYKALQETGGTPEGADGGYLVPIDIDNRIRLLEKEYLDLSTFFNVEPVSTLSGWRVIEDGGRKPLPKVMEFAVVGKTDQPKFRKVVYAVDKYGDRLPVSGELMADNAANLLAYVSAWFGPKYILTKNTLLLSLLGGLTVTTPLTAGAEVKELKKALITKLNTVHSRSAILLTNQNGYAEMDGWEDKNGRPMLVPNPADPQINRFQGRQVVYGDNDLIPDETGAIPLYIGNLKALGTLFVRKGIEMATTDVGGDAWSTGSYEVRALCRMDAQLVDQQAAMKATIATGG